MFAENHATLCEEEPLVISPSDVMATTILVVDDKMSVRNMLREYLTEKGYRVVIAANGREALFVARHEQPDLILLDVMMPGLDGFKFLELYRQERDTPVIFVTASMEEAKKVQGLELGADDYITKPFGMAELLARVRAVLRRLEKVPTPRDRLSIRDITIDKATLEVFVGERKVLLTRSEFDMLALLMESAGKVFSRASLLEALKGNSFEGSERTIDVHIYNLRMKLEADPTEPRYIQTVFGSGYRFVAGEEEK
jgi:DNA-binding response OmpR family regulator